MGNFRNRMEVAFEKAAKLMYRHRIKTLLVVFLIIGGLLTQLPRITVDISTEGFLHENDPILKAYNDFRDQFGRDEFVVVAIGGKDIFDLGFLNKLKSLHDEIVEKVPYIDDVTSLINARNTRGVGDELIVEDLLEEMPRTKAQAEEIRKRAMKNPLYKNMLISEDGKFTTVVIKTQTYSTPDEEMDILDGFSDESMAVVQKTDQEKIYLTDAENSAVVKGVRGIVLAYSAPDFQVCMAGSSAVTHFLKQSMMGDIRKFISLALIVVAIFLFVMFRRVSGVIYPLFIVIVSLLSTVSIMAIVGASIKLPTQILPSFILAVGVGYSVHILAIFFHQYNLTGDKEASVIHTVGHSGLAILMTGATTAGGLFSFSTSEVAPIADLGIFAGIGVLLAMVYTLSLLPAFLALTPLSVKKEKGGASKELLMDRFLSKVADIAVSNPYKILVITCVLMAISVYGALQLKFSHDILRWLPKTNYIRVGSEKIDKVMKGSVTLEVIIDTGKENGLYDVNLLDRVEETSAYLETLKEGKVFVGKAWSLTTIIKETNRALNENREEFYAVPRDNRLVAQELLLFENSGSDDLEDFTDSRFSKMRLMIKVPFEDAVEYSRFIQTVSNYLEKQYPDVRITVTGMTALLFRTLTNAIKSMAKSYSYALIVITILMILLIGRLRIGLFSMVPNLAPIILALGIMHWFGFPMNLFTMLVGNVAIGLAVDDTIHFMHNFRRYFEETGDVEIAIRQTLHTTGRAMLVTSCVLSLAFFIFMFASMYNIIYFGFLTGITIIMALLADYFVAPALMVIVHGK